MSGFNQAISKAPTLVPAAKGKSVTTVKVPLVSPVVAKGMVKARVDTRVKKILNLGYCCQGDCSLEGRDPLKPGCAGCTSCPPEGRLRARVKVRAWLLANNYKFLAWQTGTVNEPSKHRVVVLAPPDCTLTSVPREATT